MKKNAFAWLFMVLFFSLHSSAWAATYKLDPAHTSVSFKVRHLLTWVQGTFNEFSGTFEWAPEDPESWKADVTIQAESIDTGNADRDNHLRTADFFDTAQYPLITFRSTGVTDVTENTAKLHGVLSLHGVEKDVTLDLEILGEATDPWGNTAAGFSATTEINRKDFGLTWNQTLETGGVLVGEEVKIILDVAGIRQ